MKVRILQIDYSDNRSPEERLLYVVHQITKFSKGDFVILPEMWPLGFQSCEISSKSIVWSDYVLEELRKVARAHSILLHSGSFIESEGKDLFNTSYLIGNSGEIVSKYRKVHLFSFQSLESESFTPGQEICVIDYAGFRIGLAICYDLRFPEFFRALVEQGAELIVVTAAWPKSRLDAWKLFCKARALENQCYLIGCNACGEDQGLEMGGHSLFISPQGKELTVASFGETILDAEIDKGYLLKVRNLFPFLKDRRNPSLFFK
jgi:predicted amidohydrolase